MGNRTSALYDRMEAVGAICAAGLGRERATALLPFGGSMTRTIAWNTLMRLVPFFQAAVAGAASEWPEETGVTPAQADEVGARAGILLAQVADILLVDFDERFPNTPEDDRAVMGFEVQGRNAAPGAFMEALGDTTGTFAEMVHRVFKARKAL